jgi:hypothetical protein
LYNDYKRRIHFICVFCLLSDTYEINGRKCVWIFVSICSCLILGQYRSRIYFKELDPDINIALSRVRQSLIGNKASRQPDSRPIRRQLTWFTKSNYFNSTLSSVENARAELCLLTARADRHYDLMSFLKNLNVCVNHHSYLRQNGSVIIEIGGKNIFIQNFQQYK